MSWILTLPVLIAQAASDPAAVDAVTQPVTGASAAGMTGMVKLLIAVGVLGGSFGLGVFLANAMRLPEYGFKLGIVMLTALGSLAVCYFGWPPKLGIDLSGGVVLVYEVEGSSVQAGKLEELSSMVAARLNQGRKERIVSEVVDGKIELRLPANADVGTIENQVASLRSEGMNLSSAGKREQDGLDILVFEPDQSQKRVDMEKLIFAINKRINPGGVKEVTVRQFGPESLEIIVPEVDEEEIQSIKNRISRLGSLEFRFLANTRKNDHIGWIKRAMASPSAEVVDVTPEGRRVVARWVYVNPDEVRKETGVIRQAPDGKRYQALIVMDPYNVTGEYLSFAGPDIDEGGRDSIKFAFNSEGARRFGEFTGKNVPDPATGLEQYLGIILDGELISAPALRSQIRDNGQITGQFTKQQVNDIVAVLNAGSLPTALNKTPIQEQRISAQLGADTIAQGSRAMGIASLGVILFMFFYYRFSGAVADTAVILNMVMVIALMILIKAAFTLPGLAGLVLTVGMAVDANVLIYERMREETQRGASLRMAIRNGYAKAMSTIIDSNVTTIATGVVLYAIGSDQIKGFAITLILGLLVSLYTAVYVSRVIFDIAEKKHFLKRLNMRQWFKTTSFDFVGYMRPATIFSLAIVTVGMIAVAVRGKDLLDIDFTGGSSVQMEFRKGQTQEIGKVREAVKVLPDSTVSAVGSDNLQFKIDTSERDLATVRAELKKAFGSSLSTYSMSFKDFKPYQLPAVGEAEASGEDASKPAEKPAETPAETKAEDKSAAESSEKGVADNASGTKPAESASEGAKPADESPEAKADEKPAASEQPKQADKEKSAALQSSGSVSPHQVVLAALVFGQPNAAADKEEKPVNAAAETEKRPDSEEQATRSTEDSKVDDAKTDVTEASTVSAEGKKPETTAPSDAGTSVVLNFPERINHATLRDRINTQLEAMELAGTFFELTNSEYITGSSLRFHDWTLNILLPREQTETLLSTMQKKLADDPVFPSASEVGGKVADKTKWAAAYAILASLVIIVLYVWIRFQDVVFGFAAVAALVHDVLVTLSFVALSYWMANDLGMGVLLVDPFKISLAVVAAFLTIVGFSINDTIVIFDRIREIRGKSAKLTGPMINQAVNETLSRTFITSGTVLIATFILYVFGGAGIHPFAFAMLIGVISGTYSTVYIAAPLLLYLKPSNTESESPRTSTKIPASSSR